MNKPSSKSFKKAVLKLMDGHIVDQWSDPELYEALKDPILLDEINGYLELIDKRCIETTGGHGFYAVYEDLDTEIEHQKIVKKQFEENATKIEPIVDWLRLLRFSNNTNIAINCGDIISYADILSEVEKSTHLQKMLKELSNKIGKSASSVKEQLNGILQYLVNKDYLLPTGTTGTTFVATSRWAIFFDELQFICDHNSIDYTQVAEPEQGDLL